MLNNKKFIFFDLDGVLTETRNIHFLAFQQSLKVVGIALSEEEHIAQFDGLPTKAKLERLKEKYNLDQEKMLLIDQMKQEITVTLLKEQIKKDEVLIGLFEKLQPKYKMCVCSNARRETLNLTLDQIGIQGYFDFTLSQQDVALAKPSPEIYLKALSMFSANPEECLIFEDSPHGVLSAKNSGIDYVEVQDSYDLKNKMAMYAE